MSPFVCQRCGNCCRGAGIVRVSFGEIAAIAIYLQLPEQAFIDAYTRLAPDRSGLIFLDRPDGGCIFLQGEETPECRINPVKPRQCRTFPADWTYPGWEKECSGARESDS